MYGASVHKISYSLNADLRSVSNTNRYTLAIHSAILRTVAKKPKRMRAYRLPDQTIFEIERLSEEWECTQAEVIERAVAAGFARRIAQSGHSPCKRQFCTTNQFTQ